MKKELTKYLLIITGCFMLLFLIWFRFIRPRIPKDIPFNLSLLGFILLAYICCIYLYIVISLLRNKDSSNTFIKSIIDFIYKPLITFDIFIKSLSFIEPYYKRFLIYLAYKLDYFIIQSNIYYYIFAIFPRIVLVSALSIDTFYFHKLELLYKIIIIGILLIINRYIIYSFKSLKETLLSELELLLNEGKLHTLYNEKLFNIAMEEYRNNPNYDEYDENEGDPSVLIWVKLRDFIAFSVDNLDDKIRCDLIPSKFYNNNYRKQHNIPDTQKYLTWDQRGVISTDLHKKMTDLLKVSLILEYYDLSNNYDKTIKRIKIVIFSLYLLCWLYMLFVSIHTLNIAWIINILKASTIPDNIWIYITDV